MIESWCILDWELEVQKSVLKNREFTDPFGDVIASPVVNVNFGHRFLVWTNQILPDRLAMIRQKKSVDYINRMINLLIQDSQRLIKRAEKEYLNWIEYGDINHIEKMKYKFDARKQKIKDVELFVLYEYECEMEKLNELDENNNRNDL